MCVGGGVFFFFLVCVCGGWGWGGRVYLFQTISTEILHTTFSETGSNSSLSLHVIDTIVNNAHTNHRRLSNEICIAYVSM